MSANNASSSAGAVDLLGKTALVTGASRGIGRAIAFSLAKAGAHVIALARTVGGLEELDDDIRRAGGSASLITADLADFALVDQLGPALAARFRSIDVLVGNAAVLGDLGPITDISPALWQRVFDVNVSANWRLIKTLDPLLRASPADRGGARAIFLTSRVGGEKARAFWGPYAASKAALEMLVATYAEEVKATAIRIAIVDPGATATAMRRLAMPGEDQSLLPAPDAVTPLILQLASPAYQGIAERFVLRDWLKQNEA